MVGQWLDESLNLKHTRVTGVSLRLPGYGKDEVRLEILAYQPTRKRRVAQINEPGSGRIAFTVKDVHEHGIRVIASGGKAIGKYENVVLPTVGVLRYQFYQDPEGNVLQIFRRDAIQ